MTRHLATVALIVCLFPASLYADTAEFTISSPSANVHKAPTTASPVIGKTSRGEVLAVKRELGSWVRIPWPAGVDGFGYLHVSTGWIAHISTPSSQSGAVTTTAQRATESSSPSSSSGLANSSIAPVRQPVPASSATADPVSHVAGIGLSMGNSNIGFGVSGRAAVHDRFGVQVQVSRYAPSTAVGQPHLTSFQVAPSFLCTLPDKLSDYMWVRPYVGAGIIAYRSTVSVGAPAVESVKDNRWGQQVFGGAELAVASLPRFGLSVDYSYRWSRDPLDGFALGGPGFSVSGHWYVK